MTYLKSYEHLTYSFVPNCSGWSNCKFWEKNRQVHFVISKEWPNSPLPILTNLDNFLPGAFYSTPTHNIRHKKVYSVFTHWIDQYLLLRPNKIKKYWSLPLTDIFFTFTFLSLPNYSPERWIKIDTFTNFWSNVSLKVQKLVDCIAV